MLKRKENKIYSIIDFLHGHIIVIIIAVVILASAISTIAIVKGDAAPKSENSTDTTYETSTTVYLAMDQVESLNPLASSDRDVYHISQLIYSSLFYLDDALNLKKDLVDEYSTSAASGKVTLKLRHDAKFSDGSALTAEDVAFTITQIQRIGAESPYYEYASKIDSVTTSGKYKLTVTFADPADAALDNLVFPIVSESDYTTTGDRCVGSGPYRYSSYDENKSLKLKPNKYYYGETAQNQLELVIVPDKTKVTGLMTMDAVTAYLNDSQDADVDAEDKGLLAQQVNSNEVEYMAFNFNNRHLKQKEVRQAIAKAIDTDALISDNYGGAAISADTIYFPGFLGTENGGDAYELDQKGASDLLAACGYQDSNEDGYLEDKKGRDFCLTILVNQNNSNRVDTAQSIASALEKIGIQVTIRKTTWSAYKTAISEGDFDLYLGGYKFDKKYNLKSLFRKSNALGYDNATVREYVNKMETCISAKSVQEAYEALKPILIDELPYYCLCYKTYSFVTVQEFTAQENPVYFDAYRGCESWTWKKAVTVTEEDSEEDGA